MRHAHRNCFAPRSMTDKFVTASFHPPLLHSNGKHGCCLLCMVMLRNTRHTHACVCERAVSHHWTNVSHMIYVLILHHVPSSSSVNPQQEKKKSDPVIAAPPIVHRSPPPRSLPLPLRLDNKALNPFNRPPHPTPRN